MLSNETATLEEVAAAIGRKPEWLRRYHRRLQERHGFPARIPGGWVWPRRTVEAWLRSGGVETPQPAAANQNGAADYVAAASSFLSERYGAH